MLRHYLLKQRGKLIQRSQQIIKNNLIADLVNQLRNLRAMDRIRIVNGICNFIG